MVLSSGVFCAILKKHRAPGSVQAPIRRNHDQSVFHVLHSICRKWRQSVITSTSDEKSVKRQSFYFNSNNARAGCLVQESLL